jgi:hypothetical protein
LDCKGLRKEEKSVDAENNFFPKKKFKQKLFSFSFSSEKRKPTLGSTRLSQTCYGR